VVILKSVRPGGDVSAAVPEIVSLRPVKPGPAVIVSGLEGGRL